MADAADFSREKLEEAGVDRVFENRELEQTIREVTEYIGGSLNGYESP